jgi:hypothetical protein
VAFTYVTVQATYETADDVPAIGLVEFTPVDQMRNGLTVVSTTVGESLDNAGALSIRLAATTDPGTTPVGVTYRVVERIVGQRLRTYYVSVPHDQGSPLQLGDLTVLTGSGGASGFALRNAADYDNSLPPQDGQVMTWDSTTNKYRPEPAPTGGPGGGGVSSVNGQTGAVTITATGLGAQPVDSDLTTFASLTPPDGSFLLRQASTWGTRTTSQVKSDLALDQVDNTSDVAKPISNATSAALAGKAAATHTHTVGQLSATGTPSSSTFLRGDGAWATIPAGSGGGGTPVGLVSQTVAYSASVTLDAGTADIFTITLTGNVALAGVVGADDCQPIFLNLFASSADRTLSLGPGASSVTIPAGTWWLGTFRYRAPADLLHLVEEYVTPGTPPGGGGGGPVAATVDTGRVDTDTITA